MQLWAKEDQEKHSALRCEQQLQLQQQRLLLETQQKEQKKLLDIQQDLQNLALDVRETQQLRQAMRQCGVSRGVNAGLPTHHLPPTVLYENTRFLSFKLRENVNLEWKLKHQRTPEILMPFDVDLKVYRDVETLRGVNIGERGALALASEFVRGACSNLITLDLSRYPPLPSPPSPPLLALISLPSLSFLPPLSLWQMSDPQPWFRKSAPWTEDGSSYQSSISQTSWQ
jgi:hypothetical protein